MNQQLRIADFLRGESVLSDLAARDKEGVLRELASLLEKGGLIRSSSEVAQVLLEREKLGTTGIGDGVAIPHGKIKGLSGLVAAFARSPQGIPFEAMDGEPVRLFFLILAPEEDPSLHLKALARVARALKSQEFRRELLETGDSAELYRKILEEDARQ